MKIQPEYFMESRSETERKDHEYNADEGFQCGGFMFHTTPIEIQVQRRRHSPSASRNRFAVKYSD